MRVHYSHRIVHRVKLKDAKHTLVCPCTTPKIVPFGQNRLVVQGLEGDPHPAPQVRPLLLTYSRGRTLYYTETIYFTAGGQKPYSRNSFLDTLIAPSMSL